MFDFLLGNDLLSAILAFGIVLIPAVIVHEFGHFLAGRSVGVTILEFGIGFPPRVTKLFTWRETDFTLNLIPLGGFVRPLGEDLVGPSREEQAGGEVDDDPAVDNRYAADLEELRARGVTEPVGVNDVAPLPRIWFLAAGAIFNFVFALLVFIFIGLTGAPRDVGVRMALIDVQPGSTLAEAGLQSNDFIEQVNGEYFDSAQALLSSINATDGEVTLQIRRINDDGETYEVFPLTLPAGFSLPTLGTGGTNGYIFVNGVAVDSPADEAGLLPGDVLAAMDGEDLSFALDPIGRLQDLTQQRLGESLTLEVIRDGERLEVALTPRTPENTPEGEGSIGITMPRQTVYTADEGGIIYTQPPQEVLVGLPVGEAISYGTGEIAEIFGLLAEFPVRLIQGVTEPEERRIVSVVGISQLGGAILQDSVQEEQASQFLEYIGLISIALGVTNLLPIPALDGGRILFVLIEMIRGKPVSPEREGVVHLVGLVFLLSIGVFFIINDLMNPLTDVIP